jgi:O-antigen ligase
MPSLTRYVTDLELSRVVVIAKIAVLLGITAFMLSGALLNKCFSVAMVLVLISGTWQQDWRVILKERTVIVGLSLALLFTLGVLYSQGSWHYSLQNWSKYLKIFYLLFFIPLFTQKKMRIQAVYLLIAGVMISEVFTYLHYFGVLTLNFPPSKHWLFVHNDIDAAFIVSFTAFLLANLVLMSKKYRWLFLFCFLVCSIDILFLNQERTGYLIYLALMGLFLFQRLGVRGLLAAAVSVPLLFSGLYLGCHQFNDRINQIITNVVDYQKGNKETSIGLRLTFAEYSFKVIRHNLIFGAGTGSFFEVYRAMNGPKIDSETRPTHPHNEYIAMLFQLGLIGLIVFIYWLYLQLAVSFTLPSFEKYNFQGLILGFSLLSICHASLLVNPAGGCYILFFAVFLAAKFKLTGDQCV